MTEQERIQSLMKTNAPLNPYTNQSIAHIGEKAPCRIGPSKIVICDNRKGGYIKNFTRIGISAVLLIVTIFLTAITIHIEFNTGSGSTIPLISPLIFPPIAVLIGVLVAKIGKWGK